MAVKNFIDDTLEELQLTRPDLYKSIGMSRQGFINLAAGYSVPKIGTAYRIANALNCSVTDLWPEEQFIDDKVER